MENSIAGLAEKIKLMAREGMTGQDRYQQILELAEKITKSDELTEHAHDRIYRDILYKLAQEYFRLFYVDIRTDRYLEYDPFSSSETFETEFEKEDFFMQSSKSEFSTLYEEDKEPFYEAFKKEKIIQAIHDHGEFSLIYRVRHQNGYFFSNMKGTQLKDDPDHIIVGVKNIDSDVKREKEYLINLAQARDEANRDELTGVRNRHAYLEYVKQLIQQIDHGDVTDYAIVVFDVNGLKRINDSLGHQAGDKYIIEACTIICNIFKRSPVFRVGGDEFVVIAKGDDYVKLDDLLDQVEYVNQTNAAHGGIVIAAGSAIGGRDDEIRKVFEKADADMYENKQRLKEWR